MAKLSLGILIPTWDRPDQVGLRLLEIANQFGRDQRVHVQVNPGRHDAEDIGISPLQKAVTAKQNQANIGFVANILCGVFELSEDWIWILGDDDSLSLGCAQAIQETLEMASSDTIAIVHNQWNRQEIKSCRCSTVPQLLASTIFGDILFISGTIWRRSFFLEHLELFVVQSFSCASQVGVLIAGLEKRQGDVLVFNKPLIDYQPVHRWSRFQFVQRMATLLDMDMSRLARAKLAYLMYPQWFWATKSALQQVADGEVGFIELLCCSASTLLRLLYCDPSIPVKDALRHGGEALSRYNESSKTRLAMAKYRIKNRFKSWRRG